MKRTTLAKQIAAQPTVYSQRRVAEFGRALLPIESATESYFRFPKYRLAKMVLSAMIFQAIDRRDGKELHVLADFVGRYEHAPNPKKPAVDDKLTHYLLMWKQFQQEYADVPSVSQIRKRWTIKDIADGLLQKGLLRREQYDNGLADGHAYLRRLCKRLGVPYAPARQTHKEKKQPSKS